MNNIILDNEDFRCLVRGGTLHYGDIKIILSDIGFNNMYLAVQMAEEKIDIYKDRTKALPPTYKQLLDAAAIFDDAFKDYVCKDE